MSLSSGLKLIDLDDYLAPSLECIKPVESLPNKKPKEAEIKKVNVGEEIEYKVELDYDNLKEAEVNLKKAEISLTDCLACSGCITSAETVLVQLQSHSEVLRVLNLNARSKLANDTSNIKHMVISLAPQVLSSLSTKLDIDLDTLTLKLTTFFKKILNFDLILDLGIAKDISLLETGNEFLELLNKGDKKNFPILESVCPGWICYAEKKHSKVLDQLSKVKSPQQIMGSLVKSFYAKRNNMSSDKIYHVTVMPCYDKKLEASRKDFYDEVLATREVDCVITSTELEQLLIQHDVDLNGLEETSLDSIFSTINSDLSYNQLVNNTLNNLQESEVWKEYGRNPSSYQFSSSSSGGYLEYLVLTAATYHHNLNLKLDLVDDILDQGASLTHPARKETNIATDDGKDCFAQLVVQTVRNSDKREVLLTDQDGNLLLKCMAAYGFRNIQNVIKSTKIPSKNNFYHYVEVMACPSGCINGGGQLKPETQETSLKDWLLKMKVNFAGIKRNSTTGDAKRLLPQHNPWLLELYKEWFLIQGGDKDLLKRDNVVDNEVYGKAIRTQYHAIQESVPSITTGLASNW